MTAPQWQTEITLNGEPVQFVQNAEIVLEKLGIQYDAIETEDADAGLYLVGFLGQNRTYLEGGTEVYVAETVDRAELGVYVPQP